MVMSDNTRNFYGRSAGLVEERYMAAVFGTFRAAVEEHLPVTVINDWNLNAGGPGAVQGAGPAEHGLPRRRAGRGDRRVRRERRRAGGQPRHVAVRRIRRPARELRPGRDCWASTIAGCRSSAGAAAAKSSTSTLPSRIGPDYWEKRKNVFDFQQDPASFLNQGRMKTYVGEEQRDVQGPGGARGAAQPMPSVIGTLRAKNVADAVDYPGRGDAQVRQGTRRVLRRRIRRGLLPLRLSLPAAGAEARDPAGRPATPPPVAVEAPMCVHATVMRQIEGRRSGWSSTCSTT